MAAAEEKWKRDEEDLRLRAEAFCRDMEEDEDQEDKMENKDNPNFLHEATDHKLKKTMLNRTNDLMTALQIAQYKSLVLILSLCDTCIVKHFI